MLPFEILTLVQILIRRRLLFQTLHSYSENKQNSQSSHIFLREFSDNLERGNTFFYFLGLYIRNIINKIKNKGFLSNKINKIIE